MLIFLFQTKYTRYLSTVNRFNSPILTPPTKGFPHAPSRQRPQIHLKYTNLSRAFSGCNPLLSSHSSILPEISQTWEGQETWSYVIWHGDENTITGDRPDKADGTLKGNTLAGKKKKLHFYKYIENMYYQAMKIHYIYEHPAPPQQMSITSRSHEWPTQLLKFNHSDTENSILFS